MSTAKVKEYLEPYALADRVMEFAASSATVAEAALAVGCPPQQIAKTLSFLVAGQPVLVVLAGDCKIDNPKYKTRFQEKATMIPFDDVEARLGYPVGGVCPFATREGVAVYLDESLKRFDSVYPAAGTASSAVRLTPEELFTTSRAAGWVDVGKLA